MKNFKIKKIDGYKSFVVLNLGSDLLDLYKKSKEMGLSFYVQTEDNLQAWGLFSVCDYMKINDVSKA